MIDYSVCCGKGEGIGKTEGRYAEGFAAWPAGRSGRIRKHIMPAGTWPADGRSGAPQHNFESRGSTGRQQPMAKQGGAPP